MQNVFCFLREFWSDKKKIPSTIKIVPCEITADLGWSEDIDVE
jgi:hypothetical protein